MRLKAVLGSYWDDRWTSLASENVESITSDSRFVHPSSIFVAVSGSYKDGHDFLLDACKKNPIALIVENIQKVPTSFTGGVIQVQNSRKALSTLSHHFYSKPSEKLIGIGVTGTNGKSTVVALVENIITSHGSSCGVMGTLGHHLGTTHWKSGLTTPGAIELHKRLNTFLNRGADYFCMEVSSHAITQDRISDVEFKVCAFINLSRDHLDYHRDMESYFYSKKQLFDMQSSRTGFVVNADCPWGQKLIGHLNKNNTITVGKTNSNDFSYKVIGSDFEGTHLEINHKGRVYKFHMSMIGEYNAQNSVIALAICKYLGLNLEKSIESLMGFKGVTGRLEKVVSNSGSHVFIDYAHTPSALSNVLRSLRAVNEKQDPPGTLYVVFGCGGDRDFGKRSEMGSIAVENADIVVVTSDNPRTEEPGKIIEDILKGMDEDKIIVHDEDEREEVNIYPDRVQVMIQRDRRKAIRWALQKAGSGDIVLVAGKGHETYQIIGDSRVVFSDRAVIEDYFDENVVR